MASSDSVVRAITNDNAFRVLAASTTTTAAGVVAAQGARGALGRDLAQLVTAAVLLRETMAPDQRLQCVIDGPGGDGRLLVDAHPDGGTRGLARPRAGDDPSPVAEGALLRVSRALRGGQMGEGVVELPAGGGVAEGIMAYLQQSEQIVAVLALATVLDGERVTGAAGYIVQLLPEADRSALQAMIARLEGFSLDGPAADAAPARAVLDALLAGLPHSVTEERPVRYACRCSAERVLGAMATLARADLEQALGEGQPLEVRCDYCRRTYTVEPADLERILRERSQLN